jgi:hypothetical protein
MGNPAAPHHAIARTFGPSNASATPEAIVCFGAVLRCGYTAALDGSRPLRRIDPGNVGKRAL